jgi:hypothetical protein
MLQHEPGHLLPYVSASRTQAPSASSTINMHGAVEKNSVFQLMLRVGHVFLNRPNLSFMATLTEA